MIVNDLNIVGIIAAPQEAYTPLIIDADAGLTFTVALQCFQAIPWWNTQILQGASTVQVKQLSPRYSLKGPKAGHIHIGEQRFRLPGSERADHQTSDYYAPRHSSRDAVINAPSQGVTMLNQNGNVSSIPKNSLAASRLPSICTSPAPTACSNVVSLSWT